MLIQRLLVRVPKSIVGPVKVLLVMLKITAFGPVKYYIIWPCYYSIWFRYGITFGPIQAFGHVRVLLALLKYYWSC